MKIELKCVNKNRVNDLFKEVKFKSNGCEFKIKLHYMVAKRYEIGESYNIVLDDALGGLPA